MTEAETEMLTLLRDLVRATKHMADLVTEMSARLERNAQVLVHVNGEVPTQPIVWPTPLDRPKLNCGKCGIALGDVMSYCCPQADCPCGLGGFSCTAAA
jgi:hypothetical protein